LFILGKPGGTINIGEYQVLEYTSARTYINPLDNPNSLEGNDLTRAFKANSDLAIKLLKKLKDGTSNLNPEAFDDIAKVLNGFVICSRPIILKGLDSIEADKRRRDHWDILKDKCESDEMFKEQWDDLMVLLRLEQD